MFRPPARTSRCNTTSLSLDCSVRTPIVLDLFCGAGGMSLGFQMAGYTIGLGVEKETIPCSTHRYNLGNHCYNGRIEDIEDPKALISSYGLATVVVVVGGPPCQGFSRVGRGKLRSLHGDPDFIHDPRNQYYLEFIRFVRELQPIYFVMENVPDMRNYADVDGLVIDQAMNQFRSLGYVVDWAVLRADNYGVPQTRHRLFLIGNRIGNTILWPKKTHYHPRTVWDAIGDLPIINHNHRLTSLHVSPTLPPCNTLPTIVSPPIARGAAD